LHSFEFKDTFPKHPEGIRIMKKIHYVLAGLLVAVALAWVTNLDYSTFGFHDFLMVQISDGKIPAWGWLCNPFGWVLLVMLGLGPYLGYLFHRTQNQKKLPPKFSPPGPRDKYLY
jgi:hypothetical protein